MILQGNLLLDHSNTKRRGYTFYDWLLERKGVITFNRQRCRCHSPRPSLHSQRRLRPSASFPSDRPPGDLLPPRGKAEAGAETSDVRRPLGRLADPGRPSTRTRRAAASSARRSTGTRSTPGKTTATTEATAAASPPSCPRRPDVPPPPTAGTAAGPSSGPSGRRSYPPARAASSWPASATTRRPR